MVEGDNRGDMDRDDDDSAKTDVRKHSTLHYLQQCFSNIYVPLFNCVKLHDCAESYRFLILIFKLLSYIHTPAVTTLLLIVYPLTHV